MDTVDGGVGILRGFHGGIGREDTAVIDAIGDDDYGFAAGHASQFPGGHEIHRFVEQRPAVGPEFGHRGGVEGMGGLEGDVGAVQIRSEVLPDGDGLSESDQERAIVAAQDLREEPGSGVLLDIENA